MHMCCRPPLPPAAAHRHRPLFPLQALAKQGFKARPRKQLEQQQQEEEEGKDYDDDLAEFADLI
jgi:hypothetical protein